MKSFFNPDDINKYIENVTKPFANGFPFEGQDFDKKISESLNQWMPQVTNNNQSQTNKSKQIPYQVFETHDFVIARVPVPANKHPKVFMDPYRLTIKGLVEEGKSLNLKLPSPIRPKYAKAETRNGILEVRMMKRPHDTMTEIDVDDK